MTDSAYSPLYRSLPHHQNMLPEYRFKTEYRSGSDNIIESLYHPALARSIQYWRAVGYFSSTALEVLGEPMGEFVYAGGTLRLVTSVELQECDLQAINEGLSRQGAIEQRLLEQIRSNFSQPTGNGVALLVGLLESRRMEIRIAVPKMGTGIYHEKLGIFIDAAGNYVTFSGSSNESRNAFEQNYECVDVYLSWVDTARAEKKKAHFNQLWQNEAVGVETFDFPEALRHELILTVKNSQARHGLSLPPSRWHHQDEAIAAFLVKRRGILEMATGTGKTRTALKILARLVEESAIDTAIVTTDGTDLLDQWGTQLVVAASNLNPKFRVLRHYEIHHDRDEYLLDPKGSVLVVSRSQVHHVLRRLQQKLRERAFLIHDEVHRLGSVSNIRDLVGLSDDISYRLGLSATPEREYDEEGTAFIEKHVGPKIFEFKLEDAIRRGILCEFDYYPLSYDLADEDRKALQNVYAVKAARELAGNPMSQKDVYMEIARVYKKSPSKLPVFRAFLREHPEVLERCIVFVEDRDYGDEVLNIIHRHRYDFHTYYAEDEKHHLQEFASGKISCLVTCHRLSEGIDIRNLRNVVLFSSARSRLETIQRMGRCLRTDPHDPEKRAVVVDFIRSQDGNSEQLNADQERKVWLSRLSEVKFGE